MREAGSACAEAEAEVEAAAAAAEAEEAGAARRMRELEREEELRWFDLELIADGGAEESRAKRLLRRPPLPLLFKLLTNAVR